MAVVTGPVHDQPIATTPEYRARVNARERAVEVIADALNLVGEPVGEHDGARIASDALLARPDVLRALAGTAADTDRRDFFRDVLGDIASSYVPDPDDRAEMIAAVMESLGEAPLQVWFAAPVAPGVAAEPTGPMRRLVEWLAVLDTPDMEHQRRRASLTDLIEKAQDALAGRSPAVESPTKQGIEPAPSADDDPDGEKGRAYFRGLMDRFGHCTCTSVDDEMGPFGNCTEQRLDGCALCRHLDVDWPCPTTEHHGYPQPDVPVAEPPAPAAEPTAGRLLTSPEFWGSDELTDAVAEAINGVLGMSISYVKLMGAARAAVAVVSPGAVAAPAAVGTTRPDLAADERLVEAVIAASGGQASLDGPHGLERRITINALRACLLVRSAAEKNADIEGNLSLDWVRSALDRIERAAAASVACPSSATDGADMPHNGQKTDTAPAHPGVARVLALCDERELNELSRRVHGGAGLLPAQITAAEVRALLAGGEQ